MPASQVFGHPETGKDHRSDKLFAMVDYLLFKKGVGGNSHLQCTAAGRISACRVF